MLNQSIIKIRQKTGNRIEGRQVFPITGIGGRSKMKIMESDVIKIGEKELMDAIIGEMNWAAIEKIFMEKHHLKIRDDVEYQQGDIVIHQNQVAYRLDFNVKIPLSLLCDRNGNFLDFTHGVETAPNAPASVTSAKSADTGDKSPQPESNQAALSEDKATADKEEEIPDVASQLVDMISEINQ
jgi:hypothetical protein